MKTQYTSNHQPRKLTERLHQQIRLEVTGKPEQVNEGTTLALFPHFLTESHLACDDAVFALMPKMQGKTDAI
jgi:hypothetical protein